MSFWDGRTTKGRIWDGTRFLDFGTPRGDADVVDGLLMVLSPAALDTVRFDETTFAGSTGTTSITAFRAVKLASGRGCTVLFIPPVDWGHVVSLIRCCSDRVQTKMGWDASVAPDNVISRPGAAVRSATDIRRLRLSRPAGTGSSSEEHGRFSSASPIQRIAAYRRRQAGGHLWRQWSEGGRGCLRTAEPVLESMPSLRPADEDDFWRAPFSFVPTLSNIWHLATTSHRRLGL